MKYVIIGNSAAAIGCIEGIRREDTKGEITIIAAEPHHTYSRPLISYLLAGKTDREHMSYRPASFYRDHRVTAMLGHRVSRIHPDRHSLTLEDGAEIPYDRLLVATGSSPTCPPIEGLEQVENKTAFLSLDDAQKLDTLLSADSRVLILGAGLIGLKCAEGIVTRAGKVRVMDLADHILPSILDRSAALRVQRHMEGSGVEFLLSHRPERFAGNTAILDNGERLPFDILVVATGVRPNTELVAEAGGAVARGIVTDEHCATSLPDVYAAGDCTESRDICSGENKVLALLPNAYMQGECAGINMAGGDRCYDQAMAMNAIGFFGLHLITAGIPQGALYEDATEMSLKRLYVRENRLNGFILVGDVARAGIYTALVREQTSLDRIDFDLIRQKPQLMAFSKKERQRILGGVAR